MVHCALENVGSQEIWGPSPLAPGLLFFFFNPGSRYCLPPVSPSHVTWQERRKMQCEDKKAVQSRVCTKWEQGIVDYSKNTLEFIGDLQARKVELLVILDQTSSKAGVKVRRGVGLEGNLRGQKEVA